MLLDVLLWNFLFFLLINLISFFILELNNIPLAFVSHQVSDEDLPAMPPEPLRNGFVPHIALVSMNVDESSPLRNVSKGIIVIIRMVLK
jgi:hypothetical protein